MWRSLVVALLACGLAVGGCSSHEHEHGGHRKLVHHAETHDGCAARSTCGTCTPVHGCGWCEYGGDVGGECVSHPDACSSPAFRWTWEPAGCSAPTKIDSGLPTDSQARDAGDSIAVDGDAPATHDVADAADDVDASDSADDAEASDAIREDGSDAASPACTAPATDLGGCAPTFGGSICGSAQFTLGCHASTGASAPGPLLGCKLVASVSSSASRYYCCPCIAPTP